jgi:hypothetical protein
MHGRDSGEVADLMAAGEARRHNHALSFPHGGKQAALTDLARHVEMLLVVPEGSGHAAAARVGIDDRGSGNAAE